MLVSGLASRAFSAAQFLSALAHCESMLHATSPLPPHRYRSHSRHIVCSSSISWSSVTSTTSNRSTSRWFQTLLQGRTKLFGLIDPTRLATRSFQSLCTRVPRFEPLNGDDDIFQKVTSVCIGPASRFPTGAGATFQTQPLAIKLKPIVCTSKFTGTAARMQETIATAGRKWPQKKHQLKSSQY